MREIFIGGVAAFGALAFQKVVVEPLAVKAGRRLLDLYVGPCCRMLDGLIKSGLPHEFRRDFGGPFNFEGTVRDFLDMAPESITDEDLDRIVAEVFRVYDLRLIK